MVKTICRAVLLLLALHFYNGLRATPKVKQHKNFVALKHAVDAYQHAHFFNRSKKRAAVLAAMHRPFISKKYKQAIASILAPESNTFQRKFLCSAVTAFSSFAASLISFDYQ